MDYRPGVDVARLLSAILVVCFHAPSAPCQQYTLSGLAYLILLTFCFQGLGRVRVGSYTLQKRAVRLLSPWVFWSLFYIAIKIVRNQPVLADFWSHPAKLLIGPEIHLWFLPFAFLGGIAGQFLLDVATRLPGPRPWLFLGGVAACLAAIVPPLHGLFPEPFRQWMYALPLLPVGLGFGLSLNLPGDQRSVAFASLLGCALVISWRCGELSYLLSLVALAVSVPWKTRELPWLKYLASLSMGIYLLHETVFLVIHKYLHSAPWYFFAVAGVLGSAIASGAISLIPRLDLVAFGAAQPARSSVGVTSRPVPPSSPASLPAQAVIVC